MNQLALWDGGATASPSPRNVHTCNGCKAVVTLRPNGYAEQHRLPSGKVCRYRGVNTEVLRSEPMTWAQQDAYIASLPRRKGLHSH